MRIVLTHHDVHCSTIPSRKIIHWHIKNLCHNIRGGDAYRPDLPSARKLESRTAESYLFYKLCRTSHRIDRNVQFFLPNRESRYKAGKGEKQMLIFIFCLLAPVKITPFLRISFSAKNNNKSAMKQSNHILVEEKLHFLSLA
jgi:hypothetical protein